MSTKSKLAQLNNELMNKYEFMRCANSLEFNQRLQWLSEGMLKNHLTSVICYSIDQNEVKLFNEYSYQRERIRNGNNGSN